MKGEFLIKKKITLSLIGILILLSLVLPRLLHPDKTLQIGNQVSAHEFQFTKEIEDSEKIEEYEHWFDRVIFSEEVEEQIQGDYAEIIVQVRHYDEGISTHPTSIWIDGHDITIVNEIGTGHRVGKLSQSQLDELCNIIN